MVIASSLSEPDNELEIFSYSRTGPAGEKWSGKDRCNIIHLFLFSMTDKGGDLIITLCNKRLITAKSSAIRLLSSGSTAAFQHE